MTSSVVGLRKSSKVLPKAKLAPKKGHGHCLVVCCPPDPLQLYKSPWNHYIWEVSSANWWNDPQTTVSAVSIVKRKGPILQTSLDRTFAQPMLQMLNESVYKVSPHLPYSPDLWSAGFLNHFFKNLENFLQRKHFNNQQEAENAFQESVESQRMDFDATGINKHFSLAKVGGL